VDLCLRLPCLLQRLLRGHRDERVQYGIQSFDTGDKGLRKLDRRNSLAAQHRHGFYQRESREFAGRLCRCDASCHEASRAACGDCLEEIAPSPQIACRDFHLKPRERSGTAGCMFAPVFRSAAFEWY